MVDITGQTGGTGPQTILTTPPADLYEVHLYATCTTAGSAGTLDVQIGYTDQVAARTVDAIRGLLLDATNPAGVIVLIRTDGATNVTWTTTVTAPAGTPQYSLKIHIDQVVGGG